MHTSSLSSRLFLGLSVTLSGCGYETPSSEETTREDVVRGINDARKDLSAQRAHLAQMEARLSEELRHVRSELAQKADLNDTRRESTSDPRIMKLDARLEQVRRQLAIVHERLTAIEESGAPLEFPEAQEPEEKLPDYLDTLKDLDLPSES